jgi:hypothetical protein
MGYARGMVRAGWISFVILVCSIAGAQQQEKGNWRAASKNAYSITGDVAFGDEKISINFAHYAIAQIRTLTATEVSAIFAPETNETGPGDLYRISVPGDKKLVNKNTLCGGEETQWLATFVAGKTLRMAFFSGAKMPALTGEAMMTATNLCGTYSYVR